MVSPLSTEEIGELTQLSKRATPILRQELERAGLTCSFGEVRIYNSRTVGVQGDGRSYKYVAELTAMQVIDRAGRPCSDPQLYDLVGTVSDRITNEIQNIGRVVLFLDEREVV